MNLELLNTLDLETLKIVKGTALGIAESRGRQFGLKPVREGDNRTPGQMYLDYRAAMADAGEAVSLDVEAAVKLKVRP